MLMNGSGDRPGDVGEPVHDATTTAAAIEAIVINKRCVIVALIG
jgi:hypothetical protein